MVLGGVQLVLPDREATFELKATGDHPARQVTLKAAPVPANPFERFIVLIDQIAGILVVVAAAWLVWTRPGAMSWGFFLYVIGSILGSSIPSTHSCSSSPCSCWRRTSQAPLPRRWGMWG